MFSRKELNEDRSQLKKLVADIIKEIAVENGVSLKKDANNDDVVMGQKLRRYIMEATSIPENYVVCLMSIAARKIGIKSASYDKSVQSSAIHYYKPTNAYKMCTEIFNFTGTVDKKYKNEIYMQDRLLK